jgi:hypothetical protein
MAVTNELTTHLQNLIDSTPGDLVFFDKSSMQSIVDHITQLHTSLGDSLFQVDRATIMVARLMFTYGDYTAQQYADALEKSRQSKEGLLATFGAEALEGYSPQEKGSDT